MVPDDPALFNDFLAWARRRNGSLPDGLIRHEVRRAKWIRTNTDRDDYFLPAAHESLLLDLERFLRGRLGPVFEG